jgi:hypothetical protein
MPIFRDFRYHWYHRLGGQQARFTFHQEHDQRPPSQSRGGNARPEPWRLLQALWSILVGTITNDSRRGSLIRWSSTVVFVDDLNQHPRNIFSA